MAGRRHGIVCRPVTPVLHWAVIARGHGGDARLERYRQAAVRAHGEAVVSNLKGPLRRSRSGRMIAGVVAGLAKYFGMDPTLARVLYVVLSIVSAAFPGILVYLLLWVSIPEES